MIVYIAHWEKGEYSAFETGVIGVFASQEDAERAVLAHVGGDNFYVARATIGEAIDPIVVVRFDRYYEDAPWWILFPRPTAAADGGPLRDGGLYRDTTSE